MSRLCLRRTSGALGKVSVAPAPLITLGGDTCREPLESRNIWKRVWRRRFCFVCVYTGHFFKAFWGLKDIHYTNRKPIFQDITLDKLKFMCKHKLSVFFTRTFKIFIKKHFTRLGWWIKCVKNECCCSPTNVRILCSKVISDFQENGAN